MSPEPPTISAVLPTFNRLALLGRAIRSILRQTVRPLEIIVVDDGSTDGTPGTVTQLFPEVRLLQRQRGGASAARNAGVEEASGDWIAFLDSDDEWAPSYLETMTAAIAATGGRGTFYFSNVTHPASPARGDWWHQCGFDAHAPWELIEDGSEWVIRDRQPMLLPFTIFRKESYRAGGGLWEQLSTGEDTHLFLKLGLGQPVCAVQGEGGRVGEEDDPANRLTQTHSADTTRHWENALLLNRDLLERRLTARPEHRQVLRRRIADAHWRLFRIALASGKVVSGTRHLAASLAADPGRLGHSAAKLLARKN